MERQVRMNSEQFKKCIQNAQREHGGKRLGWQRDGNQPVTGPHSNPDTFYETLHGSLDENLQETRNKMDRGGDRQVGEQTYG
jgi:hypothetical protein